VNAVKQKKSEVLVACPPCGPFSILQRLRKYRGEEYEKALREGKELLNLQWSYAYFDIHTDASSSSNIRGWQRLGSKKAF
jgi:hypothetical protein